MQVYRIRATARKHLPSVSARNATKIPSESCASTIGELLKAAAIAAASVRSMQTAYSVFLLRPSDDAA